ncbi:MAG: hypothetical protein JWR72_1127 [Flavisolibacter sp.]|nr:hypothetical protein [Flavisolibacter sp.]
MKYFILDIIPKIQSYSRKLDEVALLTNQNWVSVNDIDTSKTVFIFRTNQQLIISENGKIEKGASWEYLGNNSLIINRQDESYLFKHGFLDETILAMKVDGLNEYAVFVNETKYGKELNDINDLIRFLEATYLGKAGNNLSGEFSSEPNTLDNRLGSVGLIDGGQLVFYPTEKRQSSIIEGCRVELNGQKPNDGLYKSTAHNRFEIKNGILNKEFRIDTHKQPNGNIIEVDCYRMQNSKKGSRVWFNDKPAPDGLYRTGIFSSVIVKNGIVV